MVLTFGQYNILAVARTCHRVTPNELADYTEFDNLMIDYYVASLLANGLIEPAGDGYKLTGAGVSCLADYEWNNPELTLSRTNLRH